MIDLFSYNQDNLEYWLSYVFDKVDYVTRNSITLLRYKLHYHEELTIVEVFLLVSLVYLCLVTYGQVKTTK